MHNPKRKGGVTPTGKPRGRPALDAQTFSSPIYLDIKCAQWLQRQSHNTGKSRSSIMRELIVEEMKRERALPSYAARLIEERMDVMAGGS